MRRRKPKIVELDADRFEDLRRRVAAKEPLTEADYEDIASTFDTLVFVLLELQQKKVAVGRLKQQLFGASTEKTASVVGEDSDTKPPSEGKESKPDSNRGNSAPKGRRKGHGRNGAKTFHGAEQIDVPHECLEPGDPCPICGPGSTVYELSAPAVLIRIVGRAPVDAKVYKLQRLRCNICGKVFTAQRPEGVGEKKYDASAAAMVGLLKYGSGLPFNRLEGLQRSLGIPLPASTQWDVVHVASNELMPVYRELIDQAAQGDVLHNDDTTIKILELMGKRAKETALAGDSVDVPINKDGSPRKGMFTSGIVSTGNGHKIALFFSGRLHAGENLKKVLDQRAVELGPPIQMCDGLSRNLPGELATIVANCLAHGRRRFADVASIFRNECKHVLEALKVVYTNDARAREQMLSPEERLHLHQEESDPIMESLHSWMTRQFDDHLVEPNSPLGEAIQYMFDHWPELTLFLREAGAPLDNNICERALKRAILHRKNSLFFRSERGARVADLFMSLIYTCQLCGANPFEYLTELLRHADELAAAPDRWMPWNYQSAVGTRQAAA